MALRSCAPLVVLAWALACSPSPSAPSTDGGVDAGDAGRDGGRDGGDAGGDAGDAGDAGVDAGDAGDGGLAADDGGFLVPFCQLPGSVIFLDGGIYVLEPDGGTLTTTHDGGLALAWLNIPDGFCVHHYATVPDARQIRFAPGGELFVASPSRGTTSGGQGGLASVIVVPDDDYDGYGDELLTFANDLPSTQGMLFANDSFYFQNGTQIFSEPYVPGQRADNGEITLLADIAVYSSSDHWAKTLDISDTGQIFCGNGGDQGSACAQPTPFEGGILEIDGSAGGKQFAMGLRNPIALKCHRDTNNHCFATELAEDYSQNGGGREKLVVINEGANWGYPCCATTNLPYSGTTTACPGDPSSQCAPDCSSITPEADSFMISETPFGFDFVDTQFPSPWNYRVMVGLHGAYGTWAGARIVAIAFDASSGLPLAASSIDGGDNGAMVDFATGWDDGKRDHGRPTDIEMSPDGRLFIADDQQGEIFWIAPVGQ